ERGERRGGFNGANGGFNGGRGEVYHPAPTAKPFSGDPRAARGYAEPRGRSGVRSGAFGGYDHGGQERGFSQRGGASLGHSGGFQGGGGGGFQGGGGGGFHGGGGGGRGGGGGHR